jgi:hypothetical protein
VVSDQKSPQHGETMITTKRKKEKKRRKEDLFFVCLGKRTARVRPVEVDQTGGEFGQHSNSARLLACIHFLLAFKSRVLEFLRYNATSRPAVDCCVPKHTMTLPAQPMGISGLRILQNLMEQSHKFCRRKLNQGTRRAESGKACRWGFYTAG